MVFILVWPIHLINAQNNPLQTLTLVSDPPNADVIVDGYMVGKTPYEINLRPGFYQIEINLEGYYTYKEKLEMVKGDEKQVLSLTLKAKPSILKIHTAPDVLVYVDNELTSEGSFDTEIEAGKHTLIFAGEMYDTIRKEVRLLPGKEKVVEVHPEKRFGQLVVKTRPKGATIFLNGKKTGTSPNEMEPVSVGKNNVEAVLEGYAFERREVWVENAKTTVVTIKMRTAQQSVQKNQTNNEDPENTLIIKPLTEKQQNRRNKKAEIRDPYSWKYHTVALTTILGVTGIGVEAAYLNKIGGYLHYSRGTPAFSSNATPAYLSSLGGGVMIREGVFGKKNRGAVFLQIGGGVEQGNNGHYLELAQFVNFGFITASFGVSKMNFHYNPSYFPYNDEIKIRVGLGVAF